MRITEKVVKMEDKPKISNIHILQFLKKCAVAKEQEKKIIQGCVTEIREKCKSLY